MSETLDLVKTQAVLQKTRELARVDFMVINLKHQSFE